MVRILGRALTRGTNFGGALRRRNGVGRLAWRSSLAGPSFVNGESAEAMNFMPMMQARVPPRHETPQTLRELKIGFVGWGSMAKAVSLGILRQDLTDPSMVMASAVSPGTLSAAAREGLQVSTCNKKLAEWADIVVMAVKPHVVDPVLEELATVWQPDKLLVSICAGVTIDTYLAGLGQDSKIVRVMPNTPCLVGEGATAYAGSSKCSDSELELIHGMFSAVGSATHRVPERLLNAVTGVSGSGPAYVYMMIQALSDAGVHGGLPRPVAQSLAAQTVLGAAKMVSETGTHPAVLKEAVTSPAGTTIAAVRSLEAHSFSSSIIEAVEASRSRAEELGKAPDVPRGSSRRGRGSRR